jgi:hypothetical protein
MTDLRYAIRQLIKSPSFSATAIIALALGIGATTEIFAVIYAFLLRPLPYANPEQLVMVQSRGTRTGSDLGVNYLDFVDWQKQNRSFSDLAFFNLRWNGNLESPGGITETLKTTFTTANLFSLLGVQPIIGRDLTRADDEIPHALRQLRVARASRALVSASRRNNLSRTDRIPFSLTRYEKFATARHRRSTRDACATQIASSNAH